MYMILTLQVGQIKHNRKLIIMRIDPHWGENIDMINTFIRLKNKYKNNPVTVWFFFTGIFISIITVSIGISSIKQIKILASEKNNGVPINSRLVDINLNNNIDIAEIEEILSSLPEHCDVKIINNYIYLDRADKRLGYPLIIQYNSKNSEDKIPIIEGTYFNDFGGNKDVLIGSDLKEFCDVGSLDKEIMIYGEKYNVIGVLGYQNRASKWRSRVVLNLKDIPSNNIEELENGRFTLQIESDKGDIDKICEKFSLYMAENKENSTVNINQISEKDETFSNLLGNNKFLFKMIIIVYLISIINLIFISNGWINTIYNEIGVMKACGMSNSFIVTRIFMELFIISIVATIAAIIFQYILSNIVNRIDSLYFYVSLENIILGVGVAAITTIITLVGPIISTINMAPIKFLKK